MDDQELQRVQWCFEQRRYDEALKILLPTARTRGSADWNVLYLIGQAYRMLDKYAEAQQYMTASIAASGNHAEVYQALGVVKQLREDYIGACTAFKQAITLQPDLDVAHNSLALTYKKMGRFEDALAQYQRALSGLFRRFVMSMDNRRDGPVYPYRSKEGEVWQDKLMEAAIARASIEQGIDSMSIPTGESATREMETRAHGGLIFTKVVAQDGKRTLLYLPNFFNAASDAMRSDLTYAILLHNIGAVLVAMGRVDEAKVYYQEAIDYTPEGAEYDAPKNGLESLTEIADGESGVQQSLFEEEKEEEGELENDFEDENEDDSDEFEDAEDRSQHNIGELKSQYAEEGGDPKDIDEFVDGFLSGNYKQARQEFIRKNQAPMGENAKGCIFAVIFVLIIVLLAWLVKPE